MQNESCEQRKHTRYLWFAQIRISLLRDAHVAVAGADLPHGKLESRVLPLEHVKHAKHARHAQHVFVCHQSHFLKPRGRSGTFGSQRLKIWTFTRRSICVFRRKESPKCSNPLVVSTRHGSTTVPHLNRKLGSKWEKVLSASFSFSLLHLFQAANGIKQPEIGS